MTTQEKKSNKNERLEMARRYESVWHYMFAELEDFRRKVIVEDPQGRIASEFAHEVAKRAEADAKLPSDDTLPIK